MRSCRSTLAIVVCLAISSPLLGAVRMPKIFSDNMVLQRDAPCPSGAGPNRVRKSR